MFRRENAGTRVHPDQLPGNYWRSSNKWKRARDEVSDEAVEAAAFVGSEGFQLSGFALIALLVRPSIRCEVTQPQSAPSLAAAKSSMQSRWRYRRRANANLRKVVRHSKAAEPHENRRLCLFPIRCRFGANIVWGRRTVNGGTHNPH